jgi:Nucleotidyl transferase of unknown function (DUF2204)
LVHAQPDKTPEALPVSSSIPMDVPEEQASLFREVLTTLDEKHVPYAVSGAFALRHHTGICRFTKDLDVFLTAENVSRALSLLTERGFHCEVCDPVWLAKAHRDGFFVDLITGMSNGVIVVEDSWIQRAQPAVVHEVQTRVLAPEELVASKLFVAMRERFDGADIAHVIYGTYGTFNWDREMELVGEHWQMLLWSLILFNYVYPAQSHYVPSAVWQELLRRFHETLDRSDSSARFRGSLVDEKMFAIDVSEWGLDNILEETRTLRLSKVKRKMRA